MNTTAHLCAFQPVDGRVVHFFGRWHAGMTGEFISVDDIVEKCPWCGIALGDPGEPGVAQAVFLVEGG